MGPGHRAADEAEVGKVEAELRLGHVDFELEGGTCRCHFLPRVERKCGTIAPDRHQS